MAVSIVTAIDVGSSTITTIIGKREKNKPIEILGMGIEPSEGIRRGVVIDVEDATRTIRRSVIEASRAAGVTPHSAIISISGAYIYPSSSRGIVAVSRADNEISEDDVRRAFAAAESFIPKNPNREILHIIPREFRVDNEVGIRDPLGMNGVRLEVDALVVETQLHLQRTLMRCIELAGIRRDAAVFSGLAASRAVLTKKQKELGVMLVDIGGGAADFVIYEEGRIIHVGSVPIGGIHITNDIAVGFQTGIEVAEKIKLQYGIAVPELVQKKENVHLAEFALDDQSLFPRKELAEIIEARLKDLFELLSKELRKINRSQLLPAGIVLVGGGARIPHIVEIAKREMKLPTSVGVVQHFSHLPFNQDAAVQLASTLGLLLWSEESSDATLANPIKKTLPFVQSIFRHFLP